MLYIQHTKYYTISVFRFLYIYTVRGLKNQFLNDNTSG